jgi:cyclopropane fatty-acyl-phospholipid synthase-like methyltransferase
MFERTGLCYIKNVPQQLPKGGRVLVHNCVHAEWQDQKPGVNDFRCWTTHRSSFEHGTVRLRMVRSAALSYSP